MSHRMQPKEKFKASCKFPRNEIPETMAALVVRAAKKELSIRATIIQERASEMLQLSS